MIRLAYFEGQFQDIKDCNVNITSHAVNYGTSAFAGIRAYWNGSQQQLYIFRPQDHFRRLLSACKLLQIDVCPTERDFLNIAKELLSRNEHREDCYLRAIAYKGSGSLGARLHGLPGDVCIFSQPMERLHKNSSGLKVGVSSWRKVSSSAIPARSKICGTYVNNALAKTESVEAGFDEPIFLTADGYVAEASAANIFLVRNGVLVTPSVTSDILEGITRNSIITIAQSHFRLSIEQRRVDRSELYDSDEIFLCGTGMEIKPIIQVDGKTVSAGAVGKITAEVDQCYRKIIRNEVPEFSNQWCLPVYV